MVIMYFEETVCIQLGLSNSKINSITCKLLLAFETNEIEFQIDDGDIIRWPASIASMKKPDEDKTAVRVTKYTYQGGTNKNNHF